MKEKRIRLAKINPEITVREIGDFIVNYLKKFNKTGGVIGLSGGVDSTVVAAIAKKAFDNYNRKKPEKNLELVGYMLPSKINNTKDTRDGIDIAEKLNIRYEVRNIEPIVNAYEKTNPEVMNSSYNKGNLISRIRANILSTKASIENKLVIGTGNKDEDYGIGYYTMFGDGAVHINPIGNLPKRLVRQIADYFGFHEIAKKTPAAGLELGQTDFKDLGYDYYAVELVLEGIQQGFSRGELYSHSQIKNTITPNLKFSRFSRIEDIVNDIIWRHCNIALPKQSLIHPPTAPINNMRYE